MHGMKSRSFVSSSPAPAGSLSPLDGHLVGALLELLRPLVERTVASVVERLDRDRATLGDRLAFSEAEAAALIGVQRHVLRDARLRGELEGSRVGKGIRYEKQEILRYLASRRGL